MSLLGIGIDIVEINRIDPIIVPKVLSEDEQSYYHNIKSERRKSEFLGGRFAVKEALLKAIGTNIDFSIVNIVSNGQPQFDQNTKETISRVLKTSIINAHISISHTANNAIGLVILE